MITSQIFLVVPLFRLTLRRPERTTSSKQTGNLFATATYQQHFKMIECTRLKIWDFPVIYHAKNTVVIEKQTRSCIGKVVIVMN